MHRDDDDEEEKPKQDGDGVAAKKPKRTGIKSMVKLPVSLNGKR